MRRCGRVVWVSSMMVGLIANAITRIIAASSVNRALYHGQKSGADNRSLASVIWLRLNHAPGRAAMAIGDARVRHGERLAIPSREIKSLMVKPAYRT